MPLHPALHFLQPPASPSTLPRWTVPPHPHPQPVPTPLSPSNAASSPLQPLHPPIPPATCCKPHPPVHPAPHQPICNPQSPYNPLLTKRINPPHSHAQPAPHITLAPNPRHYRPLLIPSPLTATPTSPPTPQEDRSRSDHSGRLEERICLELADRGLIRFLI